MDDDVAAYIDAIDADHRHLFDRVHRLVMEVQPEARVVLSYKMPTYVAGTRQLHVGVWKHGLSFYGRSMPQTGASSPVIRTSTTARAR